MSVRLLILLMSLLHLTHNCSASSVYSPTTTSVFATDATTSEHISDIGMAHSQQHKTFTRGLQEDDKLCEIPISRGTDDNNIKDVYTIGVLAIRGFDAAFNEFNDTFATYLTETAGRRFNPPIQFELKPLNFLTLFTDVETETVDYIYVNPSAYSCIESEYQAQSLVSQVSRRRVGSNVYDLKKFGGVIATLADRDDIQTIQDLRNKIVAAASISGLGSGQMQFKRMVDNGMNYLQDPKQLVFTSNQNKVIQGVLNGTFDVGFVRTDQLERSTDANGNSIDLSRIKVVDPVPDLQIDGTPFPFQSSTELYAEWNVAALTHVNPTVSREVQEAMLSIQEQASIGQALEDCILSNSTESCENTPLTDLYNGPVQCSSTHTTVSAAYTARRSGKYAGWTTSLSYMQLRNMQVATGFISQEPGTNTWRCVRSAELYDAISCPAGSNRKTRDEVRRSCSEAGLPCKDGFQCLCRPCEIPVEIVCVDSVRMGDKCVELEVFLPCIIIPVLAVVGLCLYFHLKHRRRKDDSFWVVRPSQLEFDDPLKVIGRGTFGLVLLAEYRGTEVAVKRVMPTRLANHVKKKTIDSMFDEVSDQTSVNPSTDEYNDAELGGQSVSHSLPRCTMPPKLKDKLKKYAYERKLQEMTIQERFNFTAAIKRFRFREDSREMLMADFVDEIRHLARLRHPCITTVMGAVMPTRHNEPMLVMEYMEYGSLYDVLKDESIVLKPEQILTILQDVAQGLRFLHSADPCVIHGDLKSHNVLIDTNFCAKVTDFGLSGKKQIGALETPYWMSPELLDGRGVYSMASDIFAYGMIMNEIYSGKSPYLGESPEEVIRDTCDIFIRKRPPIPLHCPDQIAKVMNDCFEHDVFQRPTAEQIGLALKKELNVTEKLNRLESLNNDLRVASQEISNASDMQLQHFACMSHEIRTPLNCIIGLSSVLEETDLNPMQRESLEMIVSSGRLLRQIVDDVLDYSKLESGNAQVLIENINLQETLNAILHLIQTNETSVKKNVRVVSQYDPILSEFIYSDNRRIQQVLFNLLGNAIKFSHDNSNVKLSVKLLDKPRRIRFVIKDNGKGIKPEELALIFEPFHQTETGLSNNVGGTGLGLSITKKLVNAMEGHISVDSDLGKWTRFTVDLPFHFKNKVIDVDELSSRLRNVTILLVAGDNDTHAKHAMEVFDYYGVRFVHFTHMSALKESMDTQAEPFDSTSVTTDLFIGLSHEDLCEVVICEALLEKFPACLTTYGPKFSIERMTKKHWRSIADIFPSVLIDQLGGIATEMMTTDKKPAPTNPVETKYANFSVLIAEDNVINQKVLERMLNRLGVKEVSFAKNGEEAIRMEAEIAFDLVFMDMQMPEVDGIEATQRITQREVSPDTHPIAKIVILSAHVSDSFRETSLDSGAVAYLTKPCTLESVRNVLQKVHNGGAPKSISSIAPSSTKKWDSQRAPAIHSIMDGSYNGKKKPTNACFDNYSGRSEGSTSVVSGGSALLELSRRSYAS